MLIWQNHTNLVITTSAYSVLAPELPGGSGEEHAAMRLASLRVLSETPPQALTLPGSAVRFPGPFSLPLISVSLPSLNYQHHIPLPYSHLMTYFPFHSDNKSNQKRTPTGFHYLRLPCLGLLMSCLSSYWCS